MCHASNTYVEFIEYGFEIATFTVGQTFHVIKIDIKQINN